MGEMGTPFDLHVTRGFEGDVLGSIHYDDACRRLLTFTTAPSGAWVTYDLPAIQARSAGVFDRVLPWSLMLADALAGQVSLRNIAEFTVERRQRFAELVRRLPLEKDLVSMTDDERAAVVDLCCFGYQGVWGPKVTKVAALYRPRSVPVMDSHLAHAFGYSREAFSTGAGLRAGRVRKIVDTLGDWLQEHPHVMDALRNTVQPVIPEVGLISDLRLLTIILWTSQDDRLVRPHKPRDLWLTSPIGPRIPLDTMVTVPV